MIAGGRHTTATRERLSRAMRRHWGSAERRDEDVIALYRQLGSLRRTAAEFGISHERVRKIVQRLDERAA